MNCKFCGAPVEQGPGGHRQREYCSDAHRQAYWRQQHLQDQTVALLEDLERLRALVRNQAQRITSLEHQLDIERRYLEDTTPRTFKAWLRKQPASALREKLLADEMTPARGSRALYEAHVRRLHCSEEEHQDFVRLWKLMLLQS